MADTVVQIASVFERHFQVLDDSIEKLSNREEGRLTRLFPWILSHRRITIGVTLDARGFAIRVDPMPEADSDTIEVIELTNDNDLRTLVAPLTTKTRVSELGNQPLFQVAGIQMFETNNPMAPPVVQFDGLVGFGRVCDIDQFSEDAAKKTAVDVWKAAMAETPKYENYVTVVSAVLQRLKHLPKRKAFLERRIHRFIDAHAKLVLPAYHQKYFEHVFRRGQEMRKADFVLRREAGMRPLLIELESPHHRVFRKDGEFTQPVNHARNQIAEWVSFIDHEPQVNAAGEFKFLTGPKDRLVVIGRGQERRDFLLETGLNDTLIWTYDILAQEAVERLNDDYASYCETVGLAALRPFE